MRNRRAASWIALFHHESCVVTLVLIGFDSVKSSYQNHDRIPLLTGIVSISGEWPLKTASKPKKKTSVGGTGSWMRLDRCLTARKTQVMSAFTISKDRLKVADNSSVDPLKGASY